MIAGKFCILINSAIGVTISLEIQHQKLLKGAPWVINRVAEIYNEEKSRFFASLDENKKILILRSKSKVGANDRL